MVLFRSTRNINEWVRVFAIRPRIIRTVDTVDGQKIERSELVAFRTLERRVSYASGVRKGVEYRRPSAEETGLS